MSGEKYDYDEWPAIDVAPAIGRSGFSGSGNPVIDPKRTLLGVCNPAAVAEMQRAIKAQHGYRVAHNIVLAPDGRVMAQANSKEDAEHIVEALNRCT